MAEDDGRAETDARQFFADQLRMLFAVAGRPPLKKVEAESAALARAMGSDRTVSVQRLSDWRSGKRLPAHFETVRPVLVALIRSARALNVEPPTPGLYSLKQWQRWWDRARGTSSMPGRVAAPTVPAPEPLSGVRPYRGLAVYREKDAWLFFGRAESVRALTEITLAAHGHGPVIVTGASGVGKSSLVQAGLIPELCGDGEYRPVVLTPGRYPLRRLAEAIPELADPAGDRADAVAVHRAIRAAATRMGCSSLLIVVDQTEELFTQCDDRTERSQFLGVLERASTTADREDAPATVVATMRSDFYEQAVSYPVLARALERRSRTVRPLRREDLEQVITEPAKLVGVKLESGLADLILNDLGVLTGGEISGTELPLLSHLLDTMWDRRRGGNLTVAGYRVTGGVRGSIAATAERAWKDLDDRGRELARAMLVHLVYVTTTGTDVKIARPLTQLLALGDDRATASRVLDHFVSARVVVVDAGHAELIHDAVIEAWPRLKSWIQEDRSSAALRQQLEADAMSWVESGRNQNLLYQRGRMDLVTEQDARLSRAGRRRQQVGAVLSPTAVEFLAASRREIDRAARWRRMVFAGLVVSAIVSLVTGTLAWTAKNRAEMERSTAEFQRIIALADAMRDDDPTTSAGLSLAAAQLRPDSDIAYSRLVATQGIPLARTVDGHTGPVYGMAISPDGTTLASASDDGTVRLWDLSDGSDPEQIGPPLTEMLDYMASVSFSPDGKHLAAGGGDGGVLIWDITDRDRPAVLLDRRIAEGVAVHNVRYSPTGRVVAVPYDDGTVALIDTTTLDFPVTVLPAHDGAVRTAAFRTDGSVLATTSDDRSVRLWDVTDPAAPTPIGSPLTGFGDVAHSADFDASGTKLVVSSDDGVLHLFDTTVIAAPRPLGIPVRAHTGGVWKVMFLPDGRTVASASWDGTAKLWSVDPVAGIVDELKPGFTGNGGGLPVLTVTPDGETVVTGGQDAKIRIWTLPGRVNVSGSALTLPSTDRSGRLAATGGYDSGVNLWRIDEGGRWSHAAAIDLPRPLGGANVVALSPSGTVLATAPTSGGNVRLWDVTDPGNPLPFGAPVELGTRFTSELAFTPDGATLVTGADDQSVLLWDVTDPAHPVPRGEPLTGPTNLVRRAAVSPDGRSLVVASADGEIYAWDISDPGRPVAVPVEGGHTAGVNGVSFGGDGSVLATGGDDHAVIIWDRGVDGGFTARDTPLRGHVGTVYSVSVSPDGAVVASGSDDGTVRLWDVADPGAMRELGGPITDTGVGRWQVLFLPDGTVAAAGGDGVIRTWGLDPDDVTEHICASTTGRISAALPQFELPDAGLNACSN